MAVTSDGNEHEAGSADAGGKAAFVFDGLAFSSIKEFKYPWEKQYLEMSKDFIFKNTFKDFDYLCQVTKENNTKPELEIYDVGHLYNLDHLVSEKMMAPPMHLQFVMGVLGAIRGTAEDLTYLVTRAKILFGLENFTWSVIGVGAAEINLSTMAIHMGGHVRVGLEDNIFIKRGVLAKSNAELVEKVVKLADLLHRDVASSADARRILNLKGPENVNF